MPTPPKDKPIVVPVPRIALTAAEAAAAIGVGRTTFETQIRPELRHIQRGRLVLFPVKELEDWARRSAARWSE
jgi:excisionase family DNA binding protein